MLAGIKSLVSRLEIVTRCSADVCPVGSTAHINQEEVLYTDADVLFYQEFDPCKLDLPEVMAIGPEMHRSANSWSELNWNAGVLFINLKGFSAVLPQMIHWANSRQWEAALIRWRHLASVLVVCSCVCVHWPLCEPHKLVPTIKL